MSNEHLRRALADLGATNPARRTEGAAVVRDIASALGELLPAVAGLLVLAAVVETEKEPYEQMLFTLGELSVRSAIPVSLLQPLRDIEPTHAWEAEYIEDILINAADFANDDA